MEWDHNTCLACDKQVLDDGLYCSPTCRLADLENDSVLVRMSWDHNTCLVCDKQVLDVELYCSLACRLADLRNDSILVPRGNSRMSWRQQTSSDPRSARPQFPPEPELARALFRKSNSFDASRSFLSTSRSKSTTIPANYPDFRWKPLPDLPNPDPETDGDNGRIVSLADAKPTYDGSDWGWDDDFDTPLYRNPAPKLALNPDTSRHQVVNSVGKAWDATLRVASPERSENTTDVPSVVTTHHGIDQTFGRQNHSLDLLNLDKEQGNSVLEFKEGEHGPLQVRAESAGHDRLSKGPIERKARLLDPNTTTTALLTTPQSSASTSIESLHSQGLKLPLLTVDTDPVSVLNAVLEKRDDQTNIDVTQIQLKDDEAFVGASETEMKPVSPISTTEKYGWSAGHHEYMNSSVVPIEYVNSLGHGCLGIVEEVRVAGLNLSTFVRKRVQLPKYGPGKHRLKFIQQEVHALQRLSHPHIVTIIGTYQEVTTPNMSFFSILMSPVGDSDLKSLLHRVEDTLKVARESDLTSIVSEEAYSNICAQEIRWLKTWFRCLASALSYMHAQGIRHQDIKPSNIVHCRRRVYFTDFSSSSQFEVGQTTSTENPAATTMIYRAPEVDPAGSYTIKVTNEQFLRHGRGTDVFSLGCVFVEMLVVLSEESLTDFYQSCIQRKGSYSRALDEVEEWFNKDALAAGTESEIFQECVKPLLHPIREKRPSASDFVAQFNAMRPYPPLSCLCDGNMDSSVS